MKAIVYATQGGPEVLQYKEVADPQISPSEVLVRVRACALNHLDLWLRMGGPNLKVPLPHIPGSDIAGEVAQIGDKVTNVKVGERVLLQPGISCGQCASCLCGQDSMCPSYTLFGQGVDGGCAEYVKSPAVNCVSIPEKLSFEEAAAFPLVSLTAWHMLIGRAKLQPAETVLVLGAGSGVGSAAIQIAKAAGARVIATAGSDTKLEKARELGADAPRPLEQPIGRVGVFTADLRVQGGNVIGGHRQRQSGAESGDQMARQIGLVVGPAVLFELRMAPQIGLGEGLDRAGGLDGLLRCLRIETVGDLTQV